MCVKTTNDLEYEMAALLLAGGGGFVLSHLARHWAGLRPDYNVVFIDRSPPDTPLSDFFQPVAAQIEVICGDFSDSTSGAGFPVR